MERAGEGHAAVGIPADLIRAFWHQGWNLKVSPGGQREGEALTDESNVHDENLARFWQRHPTNNPQKTPSLTAIAAPPRRNRLVPSKTTSLTRSEAPVRGSGEELCCTASQHELRTASDGGKRSSGHERFL
jgi:hypothetical protein